jgi:hypothetical protein
MAIFQALCAGLGLSAACGLRVFLPLFIAAIATRAGALVVGPEFSWLGSNAAIVLFGTATVVEIVGFLVPWVDHVLDLLAAPLAAVAGAILMTSQLVSLAPSAEGAAAMPLIHPAVAWSLGIIIGASAASGVEAASIAGRLSSSVLTIGWLNPIYGMFETGLALVFSLITIWLPMLAGIVVLMFLPLLLLAVWRILAWRSKQRRAHEEKLRQARERIAQAMSHHSDRIAADRVAGAAAGHAPDGRPGAGPSA